MKKLFSFLVFCSLLCSSRSWAQATFNNPYGTPANAYDIDSKRIDDPSSPVVIAQGAAQSKTYSIVLWRSPNTPVSGSVKLFYGGSSQSSISTTTTLATTTLNSSSSWSYDGGSGQDRLSIAGNISLSAADAGSYSAIYAVFYSGTSTIPTEISHPVYISVQAASTGGGNSSSPFFVTKHTSVGEVGSSKQIIITGSGLTATRSISLNGQNITFSIINDYEIHCNPIILPSKGDYSLVVTPASGAAFTGLFHVVTPLATFFPCSSASNSPEICFNQCVVAGSALTQLNGRVLAISSSEYDDYNNTYYWEHNASNDGQFGSTNEREQVQWQYS